MSWPRNALMRLVLAAPSRNHRIQRSHAFDRSSNSADARPRSCNKSPYNSILDALGGYSLFIPRLLTHVDFSSSALEGNFVHSHFH